MGKKMCATCKRRVALPTSTVCAMCTALASTTGRRIDQLAVAVAEKLTKQSHTLKLTADILANGDTSPLVLEVKPVRPTHGRPKTWRYPWPVYAAYYRQAYETQIEGFSPKFLETECWAHYGKTTS